VKEWQKGGFYNRLAGDEITTRGYRVGATTYFSKRIEFYRFIYLNKYLIVAFHDDAYFPLCCEVFLYFILRVEVVEI
jgi:hypothetical protein